MTIYVWDGDSWSRHADMVEAERACNAALDQARDTAITEGEWPDWVSDVCARKGDSEAPDPSELPVALISTAVDVKYPSSKLDEDGYDSEGEYWEDPDQRMCEFAMLPPDCK